MKTRGEARRQFLNNVPEVLTNLVGAQSAQRGAIKVFDSLQNVNLNKQLFYVSQRTCSRFVSSSERMCIVHRFFYTFFLLIPLLQDIFEVLMYEVFPELQHKQCSLTK